MQNAYCLIICIKPSFFIPGRHALIGNHLGKAERKQFA